MKHGQNGAINVKRAKFSEAVKTLLTFRVCDSDNHFCPNDIYIYIYLQLQFFFI